MPSLATLSTGRAKQDEGSGRQRPLRGEVFTQHLHRSLWLVLKMQTDERNDKGYSVYPVWPLEAKENDPVGDR